MGAGLLIESIYPWVLVWIHTFRLYCTTTYLKLPLDETWTPELAQSRSEAIDPTFPRIWNGLRLHVHFKPLSMTAMHYCVTVFKLAWLSRVLSPLFSLSLPPLGQATMAQLSNSSVIMAKHTPAEHRKWHFCPKCVYKSIHKADVKRHLKRHQPC